MATIFVRRTSINRSLAVHRSPAPFGLIADCGQHPRLAVVGRRGALADDGRPYAFDRALFAVSALYHRIHWRSPSARSWMRRLDHSMIFMLIAGTYTPLALLALHGTIALAVLIAVWAGALAGVVFKLSWIDVQKWLAAAAYAALGWAAVAALLAATIDLAGLTLLGLGGVLYTVGAVVYAAKRPDPVPAVFG